MRVRIASHNMGNGSRLLAEALSHRLGQRVLRLRRDSTFVARSGDVVINWGRGNGEILLFPTVINSGHQVRVAQDKLSSLQAMHYAGVRTVPFTVDRSEAERWLTGGVDGMPPGPIVARTLLRASSARGIVLVNSIEEMVNAPLYTKYIKKSAEYRVHVMNGKVIDYAQKKARADQEGINYQIRSHDNGWVFAREGVHPPTCVLDEATKAVTALGLDFGAVDVIYNQHHNRAYVLEVNTAPGLEGTTVERYADAFMEVINGTQATS